jgi:hypothetical protein
VDVRKESFKIFITNELTWEARKVLEEFSYRWMIEEFFRNAKESYGLEEAYIRSEQGGALALFLVSFVGLLVSIQLFQSVRDNPQKKLPTVSAILAQAMEENLKNLFKQAGDVEHFREILKGWLKMIEHKKNKTRRLRKSLVVIP